MKRQILITGASRGIGNAIALDLLEKEHRIVGLSRSKPKIDHPNFSFFPLDLSERKDLPMRCKELSQLYPQLDTLILNAGQPLFGHLEQYSYAQACHLFEVNFLSNVCLIQSFLPSLKRHKKGHIIFIASEAALQGKKKGALYCASKAALRSFAQALREECAPAHIPISTIYPGMVDTAFFADQSFRPGEEPHEHLLPSDIVHAIHFLLTSRPGATLDEIHLSPQTKKIVQGASTKTSL